MTPSAATSAGPSAVIVLTGSELTRGETRDSNGPFLAIHLTTMGLGVRGLVIVPDERDAMQRVFARAIADADLVVISGGLGPTDDDRTVAVLASVLGREVVRDGASIERMQARAAARKIDPGKLPANFYKQADVVAGAEILGNPAGLAPGFVVRPAEGAALIAVLPGVPKELRAIFASTLATTIRDQFRLTAPRMLRVKVMGLGESWVEERVQRLSYDRDRIEYGISAKPGELLLRFLARDAGAHDQLDELRQLLEAEFGDDLIVLPDCLLDATGEPFDVAQSRLVHERLLAAKVTVATAESCTGGLIAKRLTDHGGSSGYFLGGVVAYQDEVKKRLLGVTGADLAEHGAVSELVARAMALGARERFAASYGIATTGIAGPGGGSADKPVGLVFIALAAPGATADSPPDIRVERHIFWGDRANIRLLAAVRAIDLLRRDL